MVWLVNATSCNFWYDNWLGNGALYLKSTVSPALTFKEFISNGNWNINLLGQYISQEFIHPILQHPIPEGDCRDELIWRQTASGRFTLSSAFQEVHQARNYSVIHSQLWHTRIPLKISFFMLKLLLNKLPLANVLWRVGVQLASKCLCCQEGSNETLEHVFSDG